MASDLLDLLSAAADGASPLASQVAAAPRKKRKTQAELLNGATLAACFHPDGRHILVATGDRDLVLYRLDDMAVIRRFPPQAATALAVDPSGAYVAAASNIVRVWSLANARPVSHVRVPADHLDAVRFAPDGALLVTGTRGGVTKRWRSA